MITIDRKRKQMNIEDIYASEIEFEIIEDDGTKESIWVTPDEANQIIKHLTEQLSKVGLLEQS